MTLNINFGKYIEWNYSLLERRVEDDLLEQIKKKEQVFIARSPLFRGLITDYFLQKGPDVSFKDVRVNLDAKVLRWVHEQLIKIQGHSWNVGLTVSELALAYVYLNKSSPIVIPGIRHRNHITSLQTVINLDAEKRDYIQGLHLEDLGIKRCYPNFA